MTKYAYSLKTTRIKETDFPYTGTVLDDPTNVAQFAHSLQDSDVEKFLVLYLDAKGSLICIKVWEGSVNHANVYIREVLKLALLSGASSIIAVHNHPSGDVTPSSHDQRLTSALRNGCDAVGLNFFDHVVVSGTDNHYYSIALDRKGAF